MLRSINHLFYQMRAEIVKAGPMLDSTSIHYQLYPLTSNSQRMMRFAGSLNANDAITPLEVSDFLYQLSHENLSGLRDQAIRFQSTIKQYDAEILPLRIIRLVSDKNYRQGNGYKKELEAKEKFIKLSVDHLKKLFKLVDYKNLPVGVASNTIFAVAKMNINLEEDLENVLIPLINSKLQNLHAVGIIESLWGLVLLGKKDNAVVGKLVNELKQRAFVKYHHVINAPWNHLEAVYDPDPVSSDLGGLLKSTSELISEPVLKTSLLELSERYK